MLLISKAFVPQKRFFNNGLIWGQNFDVLNIVQSSSWKNSKNKKQDLKKLKIEEDRKNDFDKIKNEIFWNNQNNFNNF